MLKTALAALLASTILALPTAAPAQTLSVGHARSLEGGHAKGEVAIYLPYHRAVTVVRQSGGTPHDCRRLSVDRFRCRATYWSVRHEGEEVEPGVIIETASEPMPEELEVEVEYFSIKFLGYAPGYDPGA